MEVQADEELSDSNIDDIRKKLGSKLQTTVYATNLPYHYGVDDIRRLFKECKEAFKLRDGVFEVVMQDKQGVVRALNCDGTRIMDRKIRV